MADDISGQEQPDRHKKRKVLQKEREDWHGSSKKCGK